MVVASYSRVESRLPVDGGVRLNLGCGEYPLEGFWNVDEQHFPGVDAVLTLPPLPWPDEIAEEIYMGHFLEHLPEHRAAELLRECHRILKPGGTIGVVVPDFHEIARRYVMHEEMPFHWGAGAFDCRDLDEMNRYLLFSTMQRSHHRWMYDTTTLRRALERSGFEVTGEIDRMLDRRLSTPRWYQCGLDARKP